MTLLTASIRPLRSAYLRLCRVVMARRLGRPLVRPAHRLGWRFRAVPVDNRVAAAGPERRANRRGAAPAVGGGRYPSNVAAPACRTDCSRGDPPPVPPLTETVRATADPKARPRPQGTPPEGPGPEDTRPGSRQVPAADATDSYSAKHLSVLEGLDAVRKRPGMYIGSTDGRGLQHCLWEIFDNSVDEALGGFCTRIEVILHADGSAEVRDNGRGIPVDNERKTRLSGVELVMTRLHAGGKFGGGSYTASGGLHGVGASVVNALSARLDIEVDRDGQTWTTSFRRGVTGEFAGEGPDADFTRKSGLRQVAKVPKTQDRHQDQVLAGPPGVPQGRHVLLRRPRRARQADRLPRPRPGDRRPRRDGVRRRRSRGKPSTASPAASASSASTWPPARRSPRSSG